MWQKLQFSLREQGYDLKESLLEKSELAQHAYVEGHRIVSDEARLSERERNNMYREYKESFHMACLTNSNSQHSLNIKSENLSANIKLTFYKALLRSTMTYAFPAWEFAANIHLLKLQCLQNKVLRTSGNFPRRTPVRELHKAFNIPYIYDYIIKLCRQQAEVIHNHENANVRNIGQGEAQRRKHKRLQLGGGQALRPFKCLD
jgi:hypothetical protein